MRRLSRLQILVAVAALMVVAGLAATQTVAEARRNPRPTVTQRYVPPPTATPLATVTPTPAATATLSPAVTASPTVAVTAAPTALATPVPTVAAAATPATSPLVRFSDNFDGHSTGMNWLDGSVHGSWLDVFNGYGTAGIESAGNLVLAQSPKAATQPGETHAALAVTSQQFGDVDVTLQMRTVAQLRTGSTANPWEVAWALWNYTDNTHFYYVVLKPGGFEIGKEDPAYPGAQRFLVTSGAMQFPIGRWYTVHVKQVANTFTVSVDGVQIAQFTDNERPYTSGAVGLYSEDAYVHFNNVVVQ